MRHRKAFRKLNRTSSHRMAMLRNMVTSLFEHERIETTEAKAKELKRLADKMVTLAKRGDLHARRQALAVIRSKEVTRKLFSEIKDRYLDRNGGYVRVIKKGYRQGDGAPVSIIELVPTEVGKKAAKAKKKGKKKLKERLGLGKEAPKEAAPEKKKEEAAPAQAEEKGPEEISEEKAEAQSVSQEAPPAEAEATKPKAEEQAEGEGQQSPQQKEPKDQE